MPRAAQPAKQDIPGFSQGVRINSAVRTIKLAQPICPNSKLKMVKNDEGKWVRGEDQPQNCQLAGGEWWKACEALGHEPYVTNRVWYEPQDIVEEDDNGDLIVTGTKRVKHITRRPNVSQVAVAIRINQGKGAQTKMDRFGFKRLTDIGYNEVCQFRNCQKPVTKAGKGRPGFGEFCSREHLTLVAANEQSVMLHYPNQNLNAQEYGKVVQARDRQLREMAAVVASD